MNKKPLFIDEPDDELDHLIRLNIEAMHMVSSIYGPFLSHEEFMDRLKRSSVNCLKKTKGLFRLKFIKAPILSASIKVDRVKHPSTFFICYSN